MSYTAIEDVGEELIRLLRANKGEIGIDDATIMLISPGRSKPMIMSAYLYSYIKCVKTCT